MLLENCLKDIKITGKLVVGTSGGPDSMALLTLLLEKYKDDVIVCHINHNVRKESLEEEVYLRNFCLKNNLIFECLKLDKLSKRNFEEEARNKRYAFYEEVLEKYHAKYLFLAHHGDDLIETILMKIVRGSNLEGYSGFKKITKRKNYLIIRPFIEYTKEDIIKFNKKKRIVFYTDKTNKSNLYTRNRFRKQILPFLKEEDQNIHIKFLKYANTLNKYQEYLKKEVSNKYDKIIKNNSFNIKDFLNEDDVIKEELLYSLLRNLYDHKKDIIKENHVKDIINLINNTKANCFLKLPKNLIVRKSYDKISFSFDYQKEILKKTLFSNKYKGNGYIIYEIKEYSKNGNDIIRLNSKDITLPLYIRSREDGDIIKLKGSGGTKKIKDIFIDSKIELVKRDAYPLLVDANNTILWVPGLKKSHFDVDKKEKYDIILKYEMKGELYE